MQQIKIMTNAQRLENLKQLKKTLRDSSFRSSIQARRDCLAQIVPLLNFNDVYYANAVPIADVLGRPGFSSNMYNQTFARMDSLVGQAIVELEHDLTPSISEQAGNTIPIIQITGNVGILNTGQIGSIQTHITNLNTSGHFEMAEALKRLTEAVAQSGKLSPGARTDILDQLNELGRQAVIAPDQRAKLGIIKAIFQSLAASLAVAGNLAEVWSTWGTPIKNFFGF